MVVPVVGFTALWLGWGCAFQHQVRVGVELHSTGGSGCASQHHMHLQWSPSSWTPFLVLDSTKG